MKSDKIFNHPLRSKSFLIGVISLFILTAVFSLNGFAQSLSASAEKIQSDLINDKNSEEISGEISLNQSSNNLITATTYAFTSTTGTLEDMSSGTTQLIAASSDDGNSTLQNIGFEFWYDGVRFTQFGANANGFARLGLAPTGTSFNNTTGFATTTNAPKIAAFYDDLCVGANGKVHYKTVGSAPNRKLVIEYQNMQITRGAGCAGDGGGTFQIWLFESAGSTTPGAIQFVYGNGMVAAATVDAGYTVGLQSGAATNFASVTTSSDTVSYDTANNAQLDAIAAGKSYVFTPNVPTAPSGLNFTAVTALSQTLNWTDNSSNEFGFAVYRSTDGVNYSFVSQTAANATSFNDTGLLPGTTYFYQVYAVSEGALSSPGLSGSQMTAPAGNDSCAGAGGNWSNTATWADGTVPTATDNVTIGSGCTVTVDVTTAVAFSVTINNGGVLQSPTTGTVTNNNLTVSTNVTNNGTLDFSTNGDTSGAILTFGAGNANVSFSGTGAVTDVRTITVAKGAQSTVVELNTTNFTVQGVSTDVAGFLTLTSGTFKVSGTFTATNRVFTVAGYSIPALGGFWLNNPNFTVAPQNGSPTVTGLFRVSQGTYNIGTATGNSMGFAAGSNITVEGGSINASGRFGVSAAGNIFTYTQTAGTITVCTVGNTSTTLGSFDLGTSASSTVTISGGTIVNQLAATTIDYRNQAGSGITGVTGGTLQLGNSDSGAAKNFNIRGVVPNLVMTNTSANHTAAFTTIATYNHITLNITINSGNTLTLGNQIFLFAGATLTNNGTLTHSGASARFITFATAVPQSYTGSGVVTSPMNSFEFQSDLGFTFDPAIPQIVTNRVINFVGNVTNSSKLTVGSGGASTAIVQIGNTTTPTAAGIFDSPLGYDPGTGGINISYLRTTASRVTGGEVPATRTINNLTYDDNDPMHTLTIAGGNLTANGTMTLTNGVILTGMNTLIHNGTAARTNGYVDGNLSRSYAATGAYTYHVGQNGYSPILATISTLTINPSSLTVKPNDATLPGLAPATAVSRNWTLTEGGDLTADLTFTYIDPDDVNGNEANYKVFKREMGITTEVTPNTNNPAANTASVTGVSNFSDWGIGEAIQVLTPPTISDIADQTILEDGNTGALAFTVGDAETAPAALTVAGTSSNQTLVPDANIVFGGSGANRTVTVTPVANQSGTATITVTVTDGDTMTAQDTFLLTVTAVNDAPTLDAIGNVTIPQDSPAQTVNLTGISAGGGETQVLSVTASSSNTALVPNPTVTYTSPNSTGSISFTPVAGQSGMATITVTVMDDGGTANGGVNTFSRMFTVDVTPTAGGNVTVNPGNISYATLKEAFDAINAGTHTGAVTVSINNNTTETAPAVLNGSGAGTASYTSVVIRPTADGISVSGATAQGRGLIELNGADNVTIDGDNSNTAGTNRNLTLQNTAANTVNFTSVIRVAVAATGTNSADNNTFKNLTILGSATGRNIAAATSTAGSENTTFGIFAGPGASTTDGTAAPAAVTSVLTSVAAGATATNLTVSNNSVRTVGRAVSMNGSATSVFPGLQIRQNSIGNPTAGDADQVYSIGITAQGSLDAVIADNTVWIEGYIGSSAATHGINVGVNSTAITGATIEKNKVNRVQNNNGATWSAYGINLGGGSNHIVRNNFVSGVINSQVAGTGGFGTTFGAYGIRVASGTGHSVYHNSVNLYGALTGTVNTDLTAAFLVTANTLTGIDVRNNIFSNQITGGNTASPGTRHVAIFLPTATSAMNLTLNNNDYFVGTDANTRLAQVGTTFGSGEYTSADFDPSSTTPATNFRAFSSTLSASGTNDNQSKKVDPLFVSTSDLHIAANSPMVDMGVNVGVVQDVDGQLRVPPPDIGADEPAGTAPAANDIAAVSLVVPVTGSTIPTGGTLTPQARFSNVGTATQTNVMVRFTITGPGSFSYTDTQTIASIDPNQTITVTFAPTAVLTAAGTYTTTAAVITPDANATNDTVTGSFNTIAPINGNVNVGTGQTFTSLTNPGGIFEALNLAGASGNVVVNITSDLTGETGAVALNELPSGTTLTIKPSGAARSITGSTAATAGLIKLNGADNVTIDGSLSGGTDRSLTINQTGAGAIIWVATDGANGSNNDTVKNTVLLGAGTSQGVIAGSGATLGGAGTAPQNNNTIQNNNIRAVQNAAFISGIAATDQNWTIADNEVGSTVDADKLIFRGFILINSTNMTVSRNKIIGVRSQAASTATMSGIQVSGTISGGQITRNEIRDIKQINPTGFGSNGIYSTATSTTSNLLIANNFISDIASQGAAGVLATNNGYGIAIAGGGGYNIYYNSVNMNTDQVSTASTTAALNITVAVTTAGSIDLRNNILVNTQTVGTRYAVIDNSTQGAAVFSTINYNDYFANNVGFLTSARVTLADWQTATGQDANSKAVNPLFVSATDLHLQPSSPLSDMGTPIAAVTVDFDGEVRSATTPDIGADEFTAGAMPGTLQFSSPTYSGGEAGSPFTVTVTRTGGTDGSVTVDFATSNGSATGGASCTAGVDYINNSGTLTFANGVSSQTFNVVICNDTIAEPNETINYTLTNPTGGATLGTPSTAIQTIVDDDVSNPSFTFTISDVRVTEGNSGTVNATFNVTLSSIAPPANLGALASVQYATSNGTATAGADYTATSGTLNFNSTGTQTVTVPVIGETVKEANETFFVNLSNPSPNATITDGQGIGIIVDTDRAYLGDFDNDKLSDFAVYRMGIKNAWYIFQSSNSQTRIDSVGGAGDLPVPGDYDGDGKVDIALFKPADGDWYITSSLTNTLQVTHWGLSGDKPVQGDYDGDGKTDLAVYRPSEGTWYVLQSTGGSTITQFGIATDQPVVGDFDGDFKADKAVYRNGVWYILQSSTATARIEGWGIAADKPVSGDFDGDGKTDLGIFRPSTGTWWILDSLNGNYRVIPWGVDGDIPVVADYDGDGTSDVAVFRPSGGDWYVLRSSDFLFTGVHWGQSGDIPVPAAYTPQQ